MGALDTAGSDAAGFDPRLCGLMIVAAFSALELALELDGLGVVAPGS